EDEQRADPHRFVVLQPFVEPCGDRGVPRQRRNQAERGGGKRDHRGHRLPAEPVGALHQRRRGGRDDQSLFLTSLIFSWAGALPFEVVIAHRSVLLSGLGWTAELYRRSRGGCSDQRFVTPRNSETSSGRLRFNANRPVGSATLLSGSDTSRTRSLAIADRSENDPSSNASHSA